MAWVRPNSDMYHYREKIFSWLEKNKQLTTSEKNELSYLVEDLESASYKHGYEEAERDIRG